MPTPRSCGAGAMIQGKVQAGVWLVRRWGHVVKPSRLCDRRGGDAVLGLAYCRSRPVVGDGGQSGSQAVVALASTTRFFAGGSKHGRHCPLPHHLVASPIPIQSCLHSATLQHLIYHPPTALYIPYTITGQLPDFFSTSHSRHPELESSSPPSPPSHPVACLLLLWFLRLIRSSILIQAPHPLDLPRTSPISSPSSSSPS